MKSTRAATTLLINLVLVLSIAAISVTVPPHALGSIGSQGLNGELDLGFGNSGKATFELSELNPVADMVVLEDGGILLAGEQEDSFALRRHLPNGSVDVDFGLGGVITTPFADLSPEPIYLGASAYGIVEQKDGKILLSGTLLSYPCGNPCEGTATTVMARYLWDGTLDSEFGQAGRVLGGEGIGVAALQSDGKIVVLGDDLRRYQEDGELDPTFGTYGVVAQGGGASLDLLSDDRIVVVDTTTNSETTVKRFLANGEADPTFGITGTITHDVDEIEYMARLVVQPDDKMVIAETTIMTSSPISRIAVVRLKLDGSMDTSFGVMGRQLIQPPMSSSNYVSDILLQPDGKILIAGSASPNLRGDFLLIRLDASGNLDATFGEGGIVTTDFWDGSDGTANADWAYAVALTPDYKVLAAGRAAGVGGNRLLALSRYYVDAGLEIFLPQLVQGH